MVFYSPFHHISFLTVRTFIPISKSFTIFIMGHGGFKFSLIILSRFPLKLTHRLYKKYSFSLFMAESQSRYSIVERLLRKKLEIMDFKSNIKEDVKRREQKIERLRKDLENWKQDIQEDIKREERRKEVEIDKAKQGFRNSKEQRDNKERVFDEQIKAIEEALKSIEEISKASPNIQS